MKFYTPRLPYLDTARGLAAVSVVTIHCISAVVAQPTDTGLFHSPLRFFLYGEADMIFFFIHSGFILSYAHAEFENKITGASYLRYMISRIFRIYPLFWLILILSYLLKSTVYPIPADQYMSEIFTSFWNDPVGLREFFRQSLLFMKTPEVSHRLIPQDWTLRIEILICPLIPFLSFLNKRFRLFAWIVVIVLLKVIHADTYLFEFAIGVNLFIYRHTITGIWRKMSGTLKMFCLLIAITLFTCLFRYPNIFNADDFFISPATDRLMVDAGCVMFFILILNSGKVQRVFSHPLLIRIGKICYSLYVINILLLICFTNFVMSFLHKHLNGPEGVIIGLFVTIFLAVTILISLVTNQLIEKPFNRLAKLIGNRVTGRKIKSVLSKNE